MKIHTNTGGLAETNCYMVVDEAGKVAAIIDAPGDTTGTLLGLAKQHGWDVKYPCSRTATGIMSAITR
jgi:glyoxylase-like metal-dependent hydrolase (beta-lactamase superfamily II)